MDIVKGSWVAPVAARNKIRLPHIKLSRLAKELKKWNKGRLMEMKAMADQAQQLVLQLDHLQEQRQLTDGELLQRRATKDKIFGMAVVEKIKLWQRSRLTWIKVGDANTKIFHLHANSRRCKNYIPTLYSNDTGYTTHEAKAHALKTHFSALLGHPPPRQNML
jgi:hypothetical protein